MVQIERAGNQVAVGESHVDSEAITEDAIAAPSDSEIAESEAPGGFAGSESLADEDPRSGDDASPIPPAWQSERTHKSRQIALVVAVSISGLLTAALFFSWFVRNWDSSATTAVVEVPESEPTPEPMPEPTPEPMVESAGADSDLDPAPAAAATVEAEQSDVQTTEATDPEPEANVEASTSETIPTDLLPPSPIVVAPISEDANTGETAEEAAMMELPPGLAAFTEILQQGGPIDLKPTLQAPPTLDEIDIKGAAQEDIDPMLIATPPKQVNLKSDLAIQLAFDSDKYRLADLMLLFSQLTSVPIQIDWVSFDLCGIDVHEPIAIPKTKLKSAKELLDAIAASLGSEIQDEKHFLNLTPTDDTFDAKVAELTSLDDFADGRDSAVSVLNQFLRGADAAAAAQLQVGTTRPEKQLAVLAVDSLRRIRGIDPKVADDLMSHWAQTSEDQSVHWPLLAGGKSLPSQSSPSSIAGLVRRTAKLNGASCIVFWPDAIRRRLSPTQMLLPKTGIDAATTLDDLFADFGLQVRQVDENHWWVGTASSYDRATVVVWTRPLGDRAKTLQNRIASVMTGNDTFQIAIDPQSDRALMLLPRYIVRQLPKIDASVAAK